MIICVCCVCINRFQCTICLWWSTNETVPFEFNKSTFISDYTYVGTTLFTTYCQIQATAATTRTNRSRYSIRRIFNSHSCYSSSSLSLLLLLLLSLLLSCSRTMELYHFFSRKNTSVSVCFVVRISVYLVVIFSISYNSRFYLPSAIRYAVVSCAHLLRNTSYDFHINKKTKLVQCDVLWRSKRGNKLV